MLASTPIIIEAAVQHTASFIFLHGLGDSGHGWAPVMRQLSKKFRFMKFICPHAPQIPVTLNSGMKMPAWYDIYTLSDTDENEDETGLQKSANALLDYVKVEQAAGIPNERIFIGGFSQGAATSLFTALVHPDIKLGGIIALSGYIPCRKLIKSLPPHPLTTPVFAGHGTADFVVQYSWHRKSVEFLRQLGGARITAKSYEGMQHSSCEEEIADVVEFINGCLAIPEKTEL
ncbi:hypothetical protein PSACC_03167 [Paramicrosporidium saccamoebae]|uniref:Acyl-protein thioesterase 1 n=1 Tax=Paramicrosporidium saccamoebae TaxID=1246581 RepID=A0A2H9TH01_9FUNG|nr:hypothetical protein PSACC_03167 [Paramicrosporidium saccamoebae]